MTICRSLNSNSEIGISSPTFSVNYIMQDSVRCRPDQARPRRQKISAKRRKHDPALQAKVALTALRGDAPAFRGPPQPDLQLEKDAGGSGAQGLRRPSREGRSA
jgi:hypothetical protein